MASKLTTALNICRQEHFREIAEGIVLRVNAAIALARSLEMPIYCSQHGNKFISSAFQAAIAQQRGACLCAVHYIAEARMLARAGHLNPAEDHNHNVLVGEDKWNGGK